METIVMCDCIKLNWIPFAIFGLSGLHFIVFTLGTANGITVNEIIWLIGSNQIYQVPKVSQ
jgi:hypothetical protein